MSRQVIITDIIPIVQRILNKNGANFNSETHIRDENLIEYLHEELSKNFGIRGSASNCKDLEQAILEAKNINPEALEEYVKFLLNKYISLQLKIRKSEKTKITPKQAIELLTEGKTSPVPPDRFSDFRKKNPIGPDRWIRSDKE